MYLVAVQQCKQVSLEGSEGACGVRWLSGSPEGSEPLLYLEREEGGGWRREEGGEWRGEDEGRGGPYVMLC